MSESQVTGGGDCLPGKNRAWGNARHGPIRAFLSPVERTVIVLPFGLDGEPVRSQRKVADHINRSPQRVGQIERPALAQLLPTALKVTTQ